MPKWRNWTQKPVTPKRIGNLPVEFGTWDEFWSHFGSQDYRPGREWRCSVCNSWSHSYSSSGPQYDAELSVVVCNEASLAVANFVRRNA